MKKFKPVNKPVIAGLIVLAATSMLFFMPQNIPGPFTALVLVLTVIVLFATALIPAHLSVLVFFLLGMIFEIAPADIIFSGFRSTALWLVFGGLVIGAAITVTGLGEKLVNSLSKALPGSYVWLVAGVAAAGLCVAFIMPSAMGRVLLLLPVTLALADHFGFVPGSNGRTALVLAASLGTNVPAFTILPANIPNVVMAGIAEQQLGIHLLFFEYLLSNFPILGMVKAVLTVWVIVMFFPDQPNPKAGLKTVSAPKLRDQWTVGVILACLILLWMTDAIHHISPAWVALGGAILLMFPGIGPVNSQIFSTRINFSSLFFVAGVLGIGNLIQYSGLSDLIGRHVIAWLPLNHGSPFLNYLMICFTSALAGLFTTLPGIPAVMTPLAPEIVLSTGLPVKAILMMQVVGFSTLILPYQSPPLVVAMQISGESLGRVLKAVLAVLALTLIVLIPVNYLWWQLIGSII
ncbi:SLC13 family permease [uncultured Desulfobacter sp.]|uniref:SLC13 family permease n=1 Tax=uncultured Desulfobacter sp. TaxID=240139 RepID=UPI0029F580D2|nr:SLC13 family permease [uncultured Desulfobacter sp.]